MIEIVADRNSIPLGEAASFDLVAIRPGIELQVFVQQHAVRYFKPLATPLAGLGYRYRDVGSGAAFADAAALLACFPEAVRHIVCAPA